MFTLKIGKEGAQRVCSTAQYTTEKMPDGRMVITLYEAGDIATKQPVGCVSLDKDEPCFIMNDTGATVQVLNPPHRAAALRTGT